MQDFSNSIFLMLLIQKASRHFTGAFQGIPPYAYVSGSVNYLTMLLGGRFGHCAAVFIFSTCCVIDQCSHPLLLMQDPVGPQVLMPACQDDVINHLCLLWPLLRSHRKLRGLRSYNLLARFLLCSFPIRNGILVGLMCARNYFKGLTCIHSFYPHHSPIGQGLSWFPFCGGGGVGHKACGIRD